MKLARLALGDPDRRIELEAALDAAICELLAEANYAGYGLEEAAAAMMRAAKHQSYVAGEDPDPADDPDASDDVEISSDAVLF